MKKFDHFVLNLAVLERAQAGVLSSGVINKFYVQFECGWKVLKELSKYEGRAGTVSRYGKSPPGP